MPDKSKIEFVFFGTSDFSVHVLDALKAQGLLPFLIVTFPDKPQGRHLRPKPNPVKVWAQESQIALQESHQNVPEADVYIVASYGRILPKELIYKPRHQTLNIHPSLLPAFRGPAPIQGALLEADETGVTVIRLDEEMDHGPIIYQKKINFDTWPPGYKETEAELGRAGGAILAGILPAWTKGEIKEVPQDESLATYTKKIRKEDADISGDSPEVALRKIRAFEVWPRARLGELIITKAHIDEGQLVIDRVIPPGKKEMDYRDYLRGHQ